ncbi:hypothetical protein ScPMuIL_004131 [Solemya velum]
MASRLRGFLLSGILTRNIPVKRNAIPTRTVTFSENGGILPQPPKTRFGVMKSTLIILYRFETIENWPIIYSVL